MTANVSAHILAWVVGRPRKLLQIGPRQSTTQLFVSDRINSISSVVMKLSVALSSLALLSSTYVQAFAPLSSDASRSQNSFLEAHRQPFLTGNWKLNPQTKDEAINLARDIASSASGSANDVGIFVPFPFLPAVQEEVGDKIVVGAQVSLSYVLFRAG